MSQFLKAIEDLPRGDSFAFQVVKLMEIENQRDLQMLKKEDGDLYKSRCREWPEFKQRLCPICQASGSLSIMKKTIQSHPLYGCAIDLRCKVCNTTERY